MSKNMQQKKRTAQSTNSAEKPGCLPEYCNQTHCLSPCTKVNFKIQQKPQLEILNADSPRGKHRADLQGISVDRNCLNTGTSPMKQVELNGIQKFLHSKRNYQSTQTVHSVGQTFLPAIFQAGANIQELLNAPEVKY